MIWRVRTKGVSLDFGSTQSALQFLDNYPPHIRDKVVYKEISSVEIEETLNQIKSDISRQRRDDSGEMISSVHVEWLLSRLEFYESALPVVVQQEQEIKAKEESRIGQYHPGVVSEVWSNGL